MKYWLAAFAVLLAYPAAARAEWFESSSAHFVVYADDSERDVRRFSEQLEHFHRAMAIVTGTAADPPSPSNRVTVFVVKNEREVRRLLGDGSRYATGFYIPRAGGSVAYVPRIEATSGRIDNSMLVLLHEYAHHFLFSATPFPMPLWLVEGQAEFFASAEFGSDGSVKVGMPARHRGPELLFAPDVAAAQLLDPDLYAFNRRGRFDAFYGKSWLLYHYLVFEPERSGQLREYLAGMIRGKSSRQAADEAFGDLRVLERNLEGYMRRPRMFSVSLPPDQLGRPEIAVRRLTEGEIAVLPVRLRSRRGITPEQALELVGQARAVAAGYPRDAGVLAALAEAEYDAGNDAEAIAAADAALALDPAQVNAYVQKGYALFRRAAQADEEDKRAAYGEAMKPFLELNRRENDHPLPLVYNYRSYVDRGAAPPEIAVRGLERAAELAPFDLILRFNLARQQAIEGRLVEMRYNLGPIAYHPHGGGLSEFARRVMDSFQSGPLPREEVERLFAPSPSDQATDGGDEETGE